MRYVILAVVLSTIATSVSGQRWTEINPARLDGDRRITPKEVRGVRINPANLRDLLLAAPHERNVTASASTARIRIPRPDGSSTVFSIVSYDITGPEALARYPEIRTWYGVNSRNPGQTIFLDWTLRGFHASVSGGGEAAYYIDPLFRGDTEHYQVYFRSATGESSKAGFYCATEPDGFAPEEETAGRPKLLGDCSLRQYQVAISTTHQYSNYHGAFSAAQSELVQSTIVTSINRINQVFTRDLSLRLQLVNDNDKLYFFNEESNPFTANSVSSLLRQNTAVIDARIGRGNYDLGHVYTQGGNNGVARLRSTCGTSRGAGATSHVRPENDPFNVDYVAHEMGHQLGGNHTQNNECNYSPQAGMEPGSASTIMGYAGICSPNVQGRSDDYFHGRSIEEITTWLETGDGASCANVISTTITSPQVDSISDYLVPRGTPLKLVGSASGDANLSYNWEQYDVDQAVMPPKEDNATGPLFRSFPARSDGVRYLPRFPDVLNGNDPMWETLPMVERSMNFRLTVLNQNTTYGCASEENVRLDVAGDKAPFLVTDPADANQWSRGQIAQVQWDVAGTDAAAYRSPTVDVLLTTDDGTSFDTLARSVANNGLAEVRVPDLETTNARILVRSVDNVFYNISDEDFSIVDSVGAPAVTIENLTSPGMAGCFVDVDSVNFNFLTTSAGGATAALRPNLEGMPDGVTATFLPDSIRPGGRLRVILKGFSSLDQGQYDGTLTLRSAEATLTRELSVTKLGDSNSAGPQPIAPLDEAADTRPTLQAEDTQADNFEIQISTEENFSTLIYHVLRSTPSFTPPTPLAPSTQYFWRIRGKSNQGGCTASNWATASFHTGSCFTYRGAIDSVVISDGPPTQIAEIPVEVPLFGIVRDVDVLQLDVTHSYLSDLSIELEGPSGRTVSLFNRNCSSNDNLLLSFDDEAVTRTYNCPPNSPTLFVKPPGTSLDVFDEDESRGTWTLRVTDNAINDGGMLNSVGLKLCLEGDFSLPVTFISFVATGRKDDILLRWRTEDERENAGFYVERAEEITPSTAWTELGFVPAGTDYVFTDQTARPGIDYYYRLRQTDRDGRVNYSEVRTARIGGEATTSLLLYPNPTNGRLHYRSIGPDGDNREYSLYNANGQRLRVGQLTTTSGSIDLSAFPAGFYLLRTGGKAFRIVRR